MIDATYARQKSPVSANRNGPTYGPSATLRTRVFIVPQTPPHLPLGGAPLIKGCNLGGEEAISENWFDFGGRVELESVLEATREGQAIRLFSCSLDLGGAEADSDPRHERGEDNIPRNHMYEVDGKQDACVKHTASRVEQRSTGGLKAHSEY